MANRKPIEKKRKRKLRKTHRSRDLKKGKCNEWERQKSRHGKEDEEE